MATIKLKYRPSSVEGRDGTLFFQVIHQRQVRQVNTGLRISDSEWAAVAAGAPIRATVAERRRRLMAIIADLEGRGAPYAAQDVVAAYGAPDAGVGGVVAFARGLIEGLRRIGKRSAVRRFEATLNSLLRYSEGEEVAWSEFTSIFVLGYEEFMMRRGLCRNSTSFYMRNLRAIVNRAVEQGIAMPRNPFKNVYLGVDKTVKRAVGLDVIRMIRDVDLSGHPSLDFARKVFMFAFYTRGMSFVDIAFLRKSDLQNGVLTYSRRKTRQQLMVRIEPETRRLIESFGRNDTSFLLPIITDERGDAERQYENAYFRINRNLQRVGRMLGLPGKLTLYVARHAWATIAHSNNVALSTISKAMGHDSEKTTIIYLQSLDTSAVDNANSDIISLIDRKKGRGCGG